MEHEPTSPSVKRSSASLRYWKARLQVFKRPAVWGSVFVLLLPLIFLANYWRNPEGFVLSPSVAQRDPALPNDQPAADGFEDDSTTAASPAISDASTFLEVPALPDQAGGDGQAGEQQGTTSDMVQPTLLDALLSASLSDLMPQPSLSPSELSSRNPFAVQPRKSEPSPVPLTEIGTPSLLSSPLSADLPNALGGVGRLAGGLSSEAGSSSSQATVVLSPLQAALDRSAGIIPSGSQSAVETQMSSSADSSARSSSSRLTAQTVPNAGQALPWLTPTGQYARPLGTLPLGTQLYIPQTSPFPGTTGYTLPSALRPTTSPYYSSYPSNYSNYFSNYFNYSNGAYGNFGYSGYPGSAVGTVPGYPASGYSTLPQLTPTGLIPTVPVSPYGRTSYSTGVPVPVFNTPTTVSPQPAPFSIPRTPPGRYIGGGEINTFSNP